MKILVTGAAGFIGFHTCLKLVNQHHEVYGIDNVNNYYDPKLKFDRLVELGIDKADAMIFNKKVQSAKYKHLIFSRMDLVDDLSINTLFNESKFDVVCNLAAQPGVRYSIENPRAYLDSNLTGFLNILEGCRNHKVKHLVYASSSSVYGENKKIPFETTDNVDYPISLYAATKKSNELMAHTYGHLYGFKTTGLRFFTVYGPWGRPDMSYYLFADAISKNLPIKVFNNGNMRRDFTYIDDIVEGLTKLIELDISKRKHYKIYNIGNNKSENLNDFISLIEKSLNRTAKKIFLPMQKGDVTSTWASVENLINDISYSPSTKISTGITQFIKWFKKYNNL